MAHFPDLSPYSYGHKSDPGVVHIGWLDDQHPFPKGITPPELVEKLRKLSLNLTELYRGYHVCELCEMPEDVKRAQEGKMAALDFAKFPENRNKPLGQLMANTLYDNWIATRMSNGEIRIHNGVTTYAAPALIVHYIEEHEYMPPPEFLLALETTA